MPWLVIPRPLVSKSLLARSAPSYSTAIRNSPRPKWKSPKLLGIARSSPVNHIPQHFCNPLASSTPQRSRKSAAPLLSLCPASTTSSSLRLPAPLSPATSRTPSPRSPRLATAFSAPLSELVGPTVPAVFPSPLSARRSVTFSSLPSLFTKANPSSTPFTPWLKGLSNRSQKFPTSTSPCPTSTACSLTFPASARTIPTKSSYQPMSHMATSRPASLATDPHAFHCQRIIHHSRCRGHRPLPGSCALQRRRDWPLPTVSLASHAQ